MPRTIVAHGIIFVFILLLFSPAPVAAAPWNESIVTCSGAQDAVVNGVQQRACTICDIAKVAQRILNLGIFVAVFLSAILFAWAGILLLTYAANPAGKDKAKTLFGNVLIGLLIILAAWLVIDTLMKVLVGTPDRQFGPWNQICG